MKTTLYISLILFVLAFTAFGQRLGKPTLTSSPLTAAQQKTLNEGITLHDAKRYEEAVVKYKSILAENPDATGAMYELAMTLDSKGDNLEAMELANKGTKYICDELPLFYQLMANNLDDLGKHDDAIKIYQDGLKALEGNKNFDHYRASLYFNLGITQFRLNKNIEARQSFKSAVENNYSYPSPHLLLANVYLNDRYKIPAFLAAARFLILEFNTDRSVIAASIIDKATAANSSKGADGKITVNLDFMAPTDEGDFGMIELMSAITGDAIPDKDDKKKNMTPEERFADRIDMMIGFLDPKDKKNKNTFVAKNYFPFMQEMKAKGFVKPFAYLVLFTNGNQAALKWINDNEASITNMVTWAKAYQLPVK